MDNVNALRSIAEMPINLSVEQIGALQAGIKALQEQAERENGCEFCGQNGDRIIEAFGDGWMKIVNAADHFAAETEDNDATTTLFFNIEFCPICGKRLK